MIPIPPAAFAFFLIPLVLGAATSDRSVVAIYSTGSDGKVSRGTGFWLSKDGQLVTAYHVVRGSKDITIFDANSLRYDNVTIEAIDGASDLILLRSSKAKNALYLDLSDNEPGPQSVSVIGHPRGLPAQRLISNITSTGLLDSTQLSDESGKPIFKEKFKVFMLDLTIYGGLSGAPILDSSGKVLGIIQGSLNEGGALAWGIARQHIDALLKQDRISKVSSEISDWPPLLGNPRLLRRAVALHSQKRDVSQQMSVILAGLRELKAINQQIAVSSGTYGSAMQQLESSLTASLMTVKQNGLSVGDLNSFLVSSEYFLSGNRTQIGTLSRQIDGRALLRDKLWALAKEAQPLIGIADVPEKMIKQRNRDAENMALLIGTYSALSPENAVGVDTKSAVQALAIISEREDLTFSSIDEARKFRDVVQQAASIMSRLDASSTTAVQTAFDEERAFGTAAKVLWRYQEFLEYGAADQK